MGRVDLHGSGVVVVQGGKSKGIQRYKSQGIHRLHFRRPRVEITKHTCSIECRMKAIIQYSIYSLHYYTSIIVFTVPVNP